MYLHRYLVTLKLCCTRIACYIPLPKNKIIITLFHCKIFILIFSFFYFHTAMKLVCMYECLPLLHKTSQEIMSKVVLQIQIYISCLENYFPSKKYKRIIKHFSI